MDEGPATPKASVSLQYSTRELLLTFLWGLLNPIGIFLLFRVPI